MEEIGPLDPDYVMETTEVFIKSEEEIHLQEHVSNTIESVAGTSTMESAAGTGTIRITNVQILDTKGRRQ